MKKAGILVLLLLIAVSCDYFKKDTEQIPIARVNDSYLYQEDIESILPKNATPQDSSVLVNNFINRWATQQLLIDQAKINLSQENLDNYQELVNDYKNELYAEAYKNTIVAQQLDSTITENELTNFYTQNKDNFILNDELIKVRYIVLSKDFTNSNSVVEKFRRFTAEDKKDLEDRSIQFTNYNFNDSTWVKKDALLQTFPALKDKESELLKKSNFTQVQDSLGVYLVKIEDVLKTNDVAPLSYVSPTIEQIILNKRKLELIKKLEKDITKDALKNKNFETYEKR
ncbi:peptidyl-prolyl cis-trans isomerase [Marixanthomonas ophiurae]|uniref:Peptidyl-prolyl cis-trans isomerase n=1 Tax=Marixanthomonas ophiurae TaxID=387659 RepID=A0A3E1QDK2_9FLAO|nr:peptidyl-prolyl cis-trans isomerase [Marixanthomonas ophiurae]RFN60202.1 peptidyl-prolyl cis-trans isomerase [Marixanthomonas ophiurae]